MKEPRFYAFDPFLIIHTSLQAAWLDMPMAFLSVACEGWALALIGVAVIAWMERRWRGLLATWLPLAAALLIVGFVVHFLKLHWDLPRPLHVHGEKVRVLMEPLRRTGFPSGHATAAAVLAGYLTAFGGRRVWWIWAIPLMGGVSRVYVGAHWVWDVLGGWMLGALVGLAAWKVMFWARRSSGRASTAIPT